MGPGIGPGWGFRLCLLLWSPFLPGCAHLQNGSSMPVANTDVRNVGAHSGADWYPWPLRCCFLRCCGMETVSLPGGILPSTH